MRDFREIVWAAAAASCVAGVAAAQHADAEMASYRAHVAAAEYALRLNDVARASEWLELSPAAHRGFEWRALHSWLDASIADLSHETSRVWEIAISPDGGALAVALADGSAAVYDFETPIAMKERWRTAHQARPLYRVAWSPDGTLVATSGAEETVRILDARTGEERLAYKGHQLSVPGLHFRPDGARIATGAYRLEASPEGRALSIGTVRVWDPRTGEDDFAVDVGVKPISMVRWSPDGSRIAAASWDGEVHVFGASEGGPDHLTIKLQDISVYNAVNCVAWSPDGTRLLCGSKDRTARVFDSQSGTQTGMVDHGAWVRASVWSSDGAVFATAGDDNLIKVWNAETLEPIASLRGHTGGVASLAFGLEGYDLVSGGDDMIIKRWDSAAEHVSCTRFKDSSGCYAALFTPDGERIWTCAFDGTIGAWDARTGELVHDIAAHPSDKSANTLSMTRDGAIVASCSYDKTIKLWNGSTGEAIKTLDTPWPVYHAAISPDGAFVACVGSGNPDVHLIEVATGATARELDSTPSGLNSVVFSPDGALIAASGTRGLVRVWRAADGELVRECEGLSGGVGAIAFTSDSGSIIAGGSGGRIIRWSVATGEKAWESSIPNSAVNRLAVTPDGSRVAAVGEGAHILDAATGLHLATFRPHNDTIWHCAFSADGSRLATASWDGNVVVIETEAYRVRRAAMVAAGSKE
ncbi:MAG: PQQ-binding-like beta-propeller repeat protein [Phycisphaeraceae bacterium]|nr:PQQ-binding-like beta-propeller repeat protein [Phycisphaeraceae bacterium]MBX3365686.1 PQQ-binding-like beta-propeller repeat protein [Phycisphaeraceae bacterium]